MPSTGLLPFLLLKLPNNATIINSFNALNRASSISTQYRKDGQYEKECFNALNRASSISTIEKQIGAFRKEMFQCPQPGFFHFYEFVEAEISVPEELFQCPQPGFFHFYRRKIENAKIIFYVSMPSTGLLPFLPLMMVLTLKLALSFNALNRASSISTLERLAFEIIEIEFQCPQPGFFHFYEMEENTYG